MWSKFLLSVLGIMATCFAVRGEGANFNSCDPVRTFADGKQPAREIFVAPAGSDSTGDGSETKPFKSIARAVEKIQPGVAIWLMPGTHRAGSLIGNLTGTSNAPIWLGGIPGRTRPIISGGTTGLQISRARYVVLENLEVSGATANGLNCDDGGEYANTNAAHHVLLRNLYVHDIGTGGINNGIKLSGLNGYQVIDCDVARTSSGGSGIDQVGCHHGLIARCTFTNAGGRAIQCKGGCEDIEIRCNRFNHDGDRAINIGGATGFAFFRPALSTDAPNFESRNIRVIANLFCSGDTPVAFVGTVNSLVANNTIIEPRKWALRILQETTSRDGFEFLPCGDNRFVNNLICFDCSRVNPSVNVSPGTDAASFKFANNLWFAFNQAGQSQPTLPATEAGGVYGLNPKFTDFAGGDFTLATNSPAIRKGLRLTTVKADFQERCYADPPSIGAFEATRSGD